MTFFTTAQADEHRSWLAAFAPEYLRNWERLFEADAEAAMCEAAVRRLLEENGNATAPNEDLSAAGRSPDFRCSQDGNVFFVEVTCLAIDKVTEQTGLTPHPSAGSYAPLNNAVFHACKGKTSQCADLDAAALVAVGTFHFQASALCVRPNHIQRLLTGEDMITQRINIGTGDAVGEAYLSTQLRSATFLRPDSESGMSHARSPVSGVLVCGFGCVSPNVYGALHPSPVHHFDRNMLPRVEFCRLKADYESGRLSTEWI